MSSSRFLHRLNSGPNHWWRMEPPAPTCRSAVWKEASPQINGCWITPNRSCNCTAILWRGRADIILTASFGGTTICLKRIGLAARAAELNRRAVELAKQAADGTEVLVAGSMGPTGQLLKPLGRRWMKMKRRPLLQSRPGF